MCAKPAKRPRLALPSLIPVEEPRRETAEEDKLLDLIGSPLIHLSYATGWR